MRTPMTLRTMLLVAVLAAGCSKKSSDEAKGACDGAVAKGVDATLAKRRQAITESRKASGLAAAPEEEQQMAEISGKLKGVLGKLCNEDKWSAEVITCFNTAVDIAKCKDGLTPEQRQHYTGEAMKIMMGNRVGAVGGAGPLGKVTPHGVRPPDGSGSAGSATTPTPPTPTPTPTP